MKGSGKALTRHSSLAALPSTNTTSLSSCSTLGGPFSRSSLRDLGTHSTHSFRFPPPRPLLYLSLLNVHVGQG
uniref:Uncharacterized protein n=1 Tax=Scleropages formosus TaxID=113540 RepID=A0A8C9V5B9_SCLFO